MAKQEKVPVAKVERFGEAIVIPDRMSLGTAVTVLKAKIEAEEQPMTQSANFEGHPYDVAHAFGLAIEEVCGLLIGKTTPGSIFTPPEPPTTISVEVSPGEFVKVQWGRIEFPFEPGAGYFVTSHGRRPDGTVVGVCAGEFKAKYQHVWDKIVARTRELLLTHSIFKGRVLRVGFWDYTKRKPYEVPDIKPWDVSRANVSQLVFSRELEQSIEDHILTPIRHKAMVEAAGTPFKRGVLLAGTYGCGKTLLAAAIAAEAKRHGMTVVYVEHANELPEAIRFASLLAKDGAVVFTEDIDRAADDDERDFSIDTLLNTLDGIDTKNYPIMTILTTNYVQNIYKGMVRPGRVDVALQINPPDADAAVRLLQMYLGDRLDGADARISGVGMALAGHIPAVIREIAERTKLSYISRTKTAPGAGSINSDDILRATASMNNQISLLRSKKAEESDEIKLARFLSGLLRFSQNYVPAAFPDPDTVVEGETL